MLKNISWSSYWVSVLIIFVIYYAVVFCKYYLNDFKQILSGDTSVFSKKTNLKKFAAANGESTRINTPSSSEDDVKNTFPNVYNQIGSQQPLILAIGQSVNEINNVLEHAVSNNSIREEIVFSIHHLLRKYAIVKDSQFKSLITDYTVMAFSNFCSIHLSEDELNMLWESKA